MSDNSFENLSENPFQSPLHSGPAPYQPGGPNSRHGCLTAWLALMVLGNTLSILFILAVAMGVMTGALSGLVVAWGIATGAAMLVCIALLWQFKKAGFYGVAGITVANAIVGVVLNGIAAGLMGAVGGLIGLGILYGVLQIGRPSGWQQLQ